MNKFSKLKSVIRNIIREETDYQKFFKKELEKTGKTITSMDDAEKKKFFNKVDAGWKAKDETNEEAIGRGSSVDVYYDNDMGAVMVKTMDGKNKITFKTKRQVKQLIKLLDKYSKSLTMESAGYHGTLNEDDTDIEIPAKTLGISRSNMPQVSDIADYVEFLNSRGVRTKKTVIPVGRVHMTQGDFNIPKVRAMIGMPPEYHRKLADTVIMSKDNYILDGHHRVLALYNIDKNYKLNAIQVNLNIRDLLKITDEYPKVFRKSVEESRKYIAEGDMVRVRSKNVVGMVFEINDNLAKITTSNRGIVNAKMSDLVKTSNFK